MVKKTTAILLIILVIVLLFLLVVKRDKKLDIYQPGTVTALGRRLFFDNRLSFNTTKSCGSCHDPAFAFTDGYRRSTTASGDNVLHNAPSLINVSFNKYFDWANPTVTSLIQQQQRPLFNEHPIELGAKGNEALVIQRLQTDTAYQRLFRKSFPDEKDPFTFTNIIQSIANYVSTLKSLNAPYDRFINGDTAALTVSAKKGMALFFSEALHCGSCHATPYFTMATQTRNTDSIYFNTGLYNMAGRNQYPPGDNGIAQFTAKTSDDGKFKTASLRNVAVTAPYMHDGSVATLGEVIDIYSRGGRNITTGPLAGDGKNNRNKDKRINGFTITATEKQQLIDFLYSLTDSSIFTNPSFQNPFSQLNK